MEVKVYSNRRGLRLSLPGRSGLETWRSICPIPIKHFTRLKENSSMNLRKWLDVPRIRELRKDISIQKSTRFDFHINHVSREPREPAYSLVQQIGWTYSTIRADPGDFGRFVLAPIPRLQKSDTRHSEKWLSIYGGKPIIIMSKDSRRRPNFYIGSIQRRKHYERNQTDFSHPSTHGHRESNKSSKPLSGQIHDFSTSERNR